MIAQRTRSGIVAPVHQITTVDRKTIAAQRNSSDTFSIILAKDVPGPPTRATITEFGQPLRGRDAFVFVHGVPYNTNRHGQLLRNNLNHSRVPAAGATLTAKLLPRW